MVLTGIKMELAANLNADNGLGLIWLASVEILHLC